MHHHEARPWMNGNSEPLIGAGAAISIVTATRPQTVTKCFFYLRDQVEKRTCAEVYEGNIEVHTVKSLTDFAALLPALGTNQCLVYGIPPRSPVKLVTERRWIEMGQPATHVARTVRALAWADGPGLLMLDYDSPKDGTALLDRDALVAAVRTACPGLGDAAMLWYPSTSSCIYNGQTGEEIAGIRGQRLYLLVRDASDIERAGKALLTHTWAHGYGRFEVSKSGALLEGGLFDSCVWQSNRIDFAAGARCTSPWSCWKIRRYPSAERCFPSGPRAVYVRSRRSSPRRRCDRTAPR